MQLTPEEIAEQQKNEENTKKKYITPIIQERWGKENSDNIIMEYYFTDGRVNIDGDKVSRGEKKTPLQHSFGFGGSEGNRA